MPKISIGDAELYHEDTGKGDPLLLVPGLGGVGAFWAPQVADFARDFRVVTHDHRGCGQSTHSKIRYSVEQMAEDVVRLMDRLGIESAHYVGHSTGGAIGQILAIEHPTRLRTLVLSATWAGPDPFFRRLFEARRETLMTAGVEAYLRSSILMLAPPAWVSANDALLAQQHKAAAAASAPVEVVASRIDAIVRHDRRAQLGQIRVPALVIVAADDMVTPKFYSDELAGKIPGAKYVVLEGGGHFVPTVTPAPYNSAVGGFLRAHRG